jgi:hypothetical protein
MFRYVKANIAGIVYGSASKAGEIQSQQELMERAFKLGRKLADAQPSEPV